MNYEKAYKKALLRAKYYHDRDNIQFLETIFPELKESEDEKIRKELLEHCLNRIDGKQVCVDASDYRRWAAWLEKQGEQNHTDKVEPKFRIGDTIHEIGENTIFPRVIEKIDDEDYVCNNGKDFIAIKIQDKYEIFKQKPAWSEEDEKMISLLIKIFEINHPNGYFKVNPIGTTNMEAMSTKEILDWLKSLKDGVQPKPKQEWNEEDKIWIDRVCMLLDELNHLSTLTLAKIPHNLNDVIKIISNLSKKE